jgi:hypothetical protein
MVQSEDRAYAAQALGKRIWQFRNPTVLISKKVLTPHAPMTRAKYQILTLEFY